MAFETEAKIKVDDHAPLRNRLTRLGAENRGTCLERNYVLDTPAGNLKKREVLLRIRDTGGPGALLTVKKPVEGGEFKMREEIESRTDSSDNLLRQLEILGYRIDWIYEKIRQTWCWRECEIVLDECPEIGSFVEIEGIPERIRAVAGELGLDPGDHIPDNYLGLWEKYLEKRKESRRNMVFREQERTRLTLSRMPGENGG